MSVLLGIDTGGTYTDAVLFRDAGGVLATAKALTTHHDLSIGIAEAVSSVLEGSAIGPHEISLVSLSTTLATNALVKGQGGRVCLVLIGFEEAALGRAGAGSRRHGRPRRPEPRHRERAVRRGHRSSRDEAPPHRPGSGPEKRSRG